MFTIFVIFHEEESGFADFFETEADAIAAADRFRSAGASVTIQRRL